MADPSVPEFSQSFPSPSHPLPCDCRARPGRCWYCGGPVAEPPREPWIQRMERQLTDRGRAQWAARPVVQHDDGSWIVLKPPEAVRHLRGHFACGYLNWECERIPETADDLIRGWAAEALRAGEPDEGDDDGEP
jgi:hypothetical protein